MKANAISSSMEVLNFAKANLPAEKPVFFIATCGAPRKNYFGSIRRVAEEKQCEILGEHLCLGFDTFGPFKLVGGIQKGHPTESEIRDAVAFYQGLGQGTD